jgi:hypothetical protein
MKSQGQEKPVAFGGVQTLSKHCPEMLQANLPGLHLILATVRQRVEFSC